MTYKNKIITLLSLSVSGIIFASHANADSNSYMPVNKHSKVNGFIVVGAGMAPEYDGSEDYSAIPFIFGRANYEYRYFQLTGTGAKINLINHPNWQAGPVLNFRFGRDDDVDNDIIARMAEIDDSFEAGGFIGYSYSPNFTAKDSLSFNTQFIQDVSEGHEGFLVSASLGYDRPILKNMRMGVDIGTTYASDDYMESYFGVTPATIGTSGLSYFDAEAGFKDISIGWKTMFALNKQWGLFSRISYSQLIGDASDSPIVEDEGNDSQFMFGGGVSYRF